MLAGRRVEREWQWRSVQADARAKNQKAFEESVRMQKENYAHSLLKEKAEVLRDVGKFSKKQDDPFYRMAQVQGSLTESDSHYIVKAEVPEHEKENIKVTVKDDKVIVQGSRRFKDAIDQETSKISTENYQSFREVIPLEHPVKDKFTSRHWADGILTVKIPKA